MPTWWIDCPHCPSSLFIQYDHHDPLNPVPHDGQDELEHVVDLMLFHHLVLHKDQNLPSRETIKNRVKHSDTYKPVETAKVP